MSPWLTHTQVLSFKDVAATEQLWCLTLEPSLPCHCLYRMKYCLLIYEAPQVQLIPFGKVT